MVLLYNRLAGNIKAYTLHSVILLDPLFFFFRELNLNSKFNVLTNIGT